MNKLLRNIFYLSFGVVVSLPSSSFGAQLSKPPRLSADKPIIFDNIKKESLAEGNAELHYKNLLIQAARIRYLGEEQKAIAEENVRLNRDKLRLVAHRAVYWVNDSRVEVKNFRIGMIDNNLEGAEVSGPMDALSARNVRVYYKEPNPLLGLSFDAKRAQLHGNEYIEMRDVMARIGPMPVFLTPYYRYNLQESTVRFKSDICFLKRNDDYGRYWRNDVFFDYGWAVKPGFMLDGYRKRGVLWGPMLEYNYGETNGKVKFAKMADQLYASRNDTNNQPLERSRFFLDWKQQSHVGESIDYVSQIKWQKDSQVVKDFRPDDYDGTNQHPDNFVEVAHRGEDSITTLTTRFRPNNFQRIQERLPEFRHEHLPVRIGDSRVHGQWGIGVVRLREKPLSYLTAQEEEKESNRLDIMGGLSAPFDLHDACTFTPVMGGRIVDYFGMPKYSDYTRFFGQVGFDLRFKSFGEYDYQNNYWNIDGIRHLLEPVVQYRYIPRIQSSDGRIPVIDRVADSANPTLEELDLLNRRDLDSLSEMHVLRTGLENYLYTNYKKGLPKQWLRLNLYQDFRLTRKTNETTLSDSFVWTEWVPSDFLSFNVYKRFDTTNKRLKETTGSVSFHEGDLWNCTISHTYTAQSYNQSRITFSYKLTSRHSLESSFGFDAHKPDLIDQTYTLSTLLAQTWKMDWQFKWKKRSLADRAAGKVSLEIRCVITMAAF